MTIEETTSFGYSDIKTNYENYSINKTTNVTSSSIEYLDIKEIIKVILH